MSSQVPDNWNQVTVKDSCNLVNGRAFRPSDWSTKGLPIIRIQNLRNPNAEFNYFNGEVGDRHIVNPGDLLFSWSGTPGTSFGAHIWRGKQSVLNQHIFRVDFSDKLFNAEFLKLAMNAQLPWLIKQAKGGVGLKHLKKGTVESLVLPLPPRAEQDRIIQSLETLLFPLQKARDELTLVSVQTRELMKATIGEAVRKDSRLGSVDPPIWSVSKVGETGEVSLGLQRSPERHTGPNMRPYLRVANVFEDRIDVEDVMSMHFSEDEFKKFRLQSGDILLNEGQSHELVGRPAIFRDEMSDVCFTNTLVRYKAGPDIEPEFALLVFRHYLHSGRFKAISKITTNLAHLGAKRFAQLEICFPPKREQKLIAARTSAVLETVSQIKEHAMFASEGAVRLTRLIEEAALNGKLARSHNPEERSPDPKVHRPRVFAREQRPPKIRHSESANPKKAISTMSDGNRLSELLRTLENARTKLSAKQLFSELGYPDDADVAKVEEFLLTVREALDSGAALRTRTGDEDFFTVEASERNNEN